MSNNGFTTLTKYTNGDCGDKYLSGASDADPKSGFISIDRYNYFRGEQNSAYVPIHRLVAVAEYGLDEVNENVIHHKNGVRFDNRPENLEVLSYTDHSLIEQRNKPLVEVLEGYSDEQIKRALRKVGYNGNIQ